MTGSHLYQHSTKGTNEDTTSSYSDHQHTLDRKPERLPYMKDGGTSSTTTSGPEDHTLESRDSTSTSSTGKASHQTTNQYPNHQTKNQKHPDPNQKTLATPATKNQRNDSHQTLSRNLLHQQHQSPATHTTEEDPESYRHQTNNALASLLLARNNNRPQQIWRLRLLQLQQQRLLSDLTPHQSTQLPLHRLPPQLHNELRAVYRPLYGEPLEDPADLAVLETLTGLVGLEAPKAQKDQDNQEKPLLLQPPQPL